MRGAETSKSHIRRVEEGWFEKYAPSHLPGIDIGSGRDPLNDSFQKWDIIFRDGDATFMDGVPDNTYHTVYASHILEHLKDPETAIKNWFRICKPGGHLIIVVPHRNLYEKTRKFPSRFNSDHKSYWMPEWGEKPATWGVRPTIKKLIPDAEIVLLRTLDQGYNKKLSPFAHPVGEYSIEVIVKKLY